MELNDLISTLESPKPNKQLFHNSPVQFAEGPRPEDDLFGAKDPNLAIQHENFRHRIVMILKARGLSNTEIATQTGFTIPWVSQITRQPWFRKRVAELQLELGKDAVRTAIEGAALDSVHTLIDLRDDVTVPASVRKAASDSLLDRFLGKAAQVVEVKDTKDIPVVEDLEKLDSEIAQLEAEESSND